MNKDSKIVVLGHTGLVGSAIVRRLKVDGYTNIITMDRSNLDLRIQQSVNMFFEFGKIEYCFICAALVGGVVANNTRRAEFIYDNLMIQTNIIHAAYVYGVKKLLFLGSACIYPTKLSESISEDKLLTGKLEPTNEPYAIAKIAGVKMCEAYRSQYGCNFISAMPTNMYGINDSYDLINGHVIPALMRKFIVAKKGNEDVTIWGTGTPRRDFMYSDDMADAALFLMQNYDEPGHINVGTGIGTELNKLAEMIADIIGFNGKILHDTSRPDGMKIRRLDVTKINNMGWSAKTLLKDGLQKTIANIYETNKHLEW